MTEIQGPPYEGVPPWLAQSLIAWVDQRFVSRDLLGHLEVSGNLLMEVQRSLHLEIDWRGNLYDVYMRFRAMIVEDSDLFLTVLGYLLSRLRLPIAVSPEGRVYVPELHTDWGIANELEQCLREGGSAWKVVTEDSHGALVRRIDEVAAKAAEDTSGSGGRSGDHLKQAWRALYGRDPNPDDCYNHSVKAVEVASIPVVCPKAQQPTLGIVIDR